MRFTEEELRLIKMTFGGETPNSTLLKVLRKIFLPEIDPTAPLGQTVDLWMTLDIRQMTPEQAYVNLMARNNVITHIEQQLLQLEALAMMENETPQELQEKLKKNSTQ